MHLLWYPTFIFLTDIFQIPCALSKNFAAIVISRYARYFPYASQDSIPIHSTICGIAGSPIINSVANIPDMWKGEDLVGQVILVQWRHHAHGQSFQQSVGDERMGICSWIYRFVSCLNTASVMNLIYKISSGAPLCAYDWHPVLRSKPHSVTVALISIVHFPGVGFTGSGVS